MGEDTVAKLVAIYRSHGEVELRAQIGDWVFLAPPPAADDEWSFRTLSLRTVRFTANDHDSLLDESYRYYPLKKDAGARFAATILVGRATTNDVQLAENGVSKLHARIRLTPQGPLLTDASSSNGTTVDGVRIHSETRLAHGMVVAFGSRVVQLFDTSALGPILHHLGNFTGPGR